MEGLPPPRLPGREPPPERSENHLGYILLAVITMLVFWYIG